MLIVKAPNEYNFDYTIYFVHYKSMNLEAEARRFSRVSNTRKIHLPIFRKFQSQNAVSILVRAYLVK